MTDYGKMISGGAPRLFRFNQIEKRTCLILGIFLIISLILQNEEVIWGMLLGGIIGLINFHWLWWITAKVFLENKKIYGCQYLTKFFILAGIIFLILRSGKFNALAFLIGFSAFIPAILVSIRQKNFLKEYLR